MKTIKTICVFGASTTWGAWDRDMGGWVNRIRLEESRKEDYTKIYNLSISGGTTKTILDRFENEAKIRKADALIFQSGGNDAACVVATKEHQISSKTFRRNLEKIIKSAKEVTENILFVSFGNCDESKTTPVPWADKHYTNENIRKYNEITKEVCESNEVLFFDIFGLLKNEDLSDGLHPDSQGHEKIFEKIRDFLEQQRWI